MVLMVCSFRLSVFMSSALSAYVAIMPSAIYATQPSAKLVRHLPGASTSPSKLRRSMGVSSARIAALLKHLEQKGWISRSADEHDERRVNVSLTDAGRELINSRRREAIERVAAALRSLGEEDAHEYVRLQQKMLDALSEDTFD